ncbi:fatty oxidation complex, alpha subunit [Nitrococcus mobilis Nb-231]|uniref:enoyl-CoA hydratase n=2 Tax=Nitrococcus mobilis TaxID=35797 RepID=A4BL13_9GAMM|nr:fatty oxidation complex, alpha subunit [Nitrococcus mobilis Nb-231]
MATHEASVRGSDTPRPALCLERREDGIACIRIDCPGQSQNTLGRAEMNQASQLLDRLERDESVKGIIFISGKAGSFVAGVDIHLFEAFKSAAEASALSAEGQAIFDRIAAFRVPVVAAIDGVCFGGGLELALACHARVCTGSEQTRLGLPEVQLGLLPGGGGTQRLPRLIGLPAALDLMLTGKRLRATQAQRLGLVDDRVPTSILLDTALQWVEVCQRGRVRRGGGWLQALTAWALRGNPLGRAMVFKQARKQVAARTQGNYPAPTRLIECVERGLSEGIEPGLKAEAQAFGELAMTPQARQLINLYFATSAMKKDTGVADPDVEPRAVRRVGVLGAGLMGAGISFVTAARAKVPVRLKDVEPKGLASGLKYIDERIDQRLSRHAISRFEAERARCRVTPTLDFSGCRSLDLVIEAVFEDLELKHRMIREVEANCNADVIFASNTSSLPLARIAQAAERPQNVIGLHYFSPVDRMPLLEVIAHERTAPEVIATAMAFGRAQGKTPIVVRDGVGFYVNRILAPYLNEAVHLLEEGVAIDRIDQALVRFGFPVGPFKLLDEVGIDIIAKVAPVLHEAFGERMRPVSAVERMLEADRLGKKNGRGFYRYGGKRSGKEVDESVYGLLAVSTRQEMADTAIVERTLILLLNEAARCLDEGIIREARDGDVGAVFGIGFPPFLGGPFRYMDSRGLDAVASALAGFESSVGRRYAPAPLVSAMAREPRRFYPG